MAILAWRSDKRFLCLVLAQRVTAWRVLGCDQDRQLLVAFPGDHGVFYWCLGTGMAMALFAKTRKKDIHQCYVPDHYHWLYGQQHLSSTRWRGVASHNP